jgi:hypothetical protein
MLSFILQVLNVDKVDRNQDQIDTEFQRKDQKVQT